MVPEWLRVRKPGGAAILVYITLASFGTWNPGSARYDECRPSVPTLAEETGLGESTVRRAIKDLTQLGALEVGGVRRAANGGELPRVYRVVFGQVTAPPSQVPPPGTPDGTGGVSPDTPGGVPEMTPNQEPSTKNQHQDFLPQDAAADNAGKILKGLIDWLRLPEQGPVELPSRIRGMYAKGIKKLLDEGSDPIRIKLALGRMHDRGKIGSPSLLDSFVVEVQCRPVSAPPAAPKTFKQMDRDDDQAKAKRAEAIDAALVLIQQQRPQLDWQAAYDLARSEVDSYLDNHPNGLNGSSGTGYSQMQVIDSAGDVVEVTGP
jgi:hypothetical protein